MLGRRLLTPVLVCGLAGALAACGSTPSADSRPSASQSGYSSRLYKVGKPYKIKGIWYYPQIDYGYVEEGIASWYGPGFHGKATANGEAYDQNDMTAAHRTLPMPSIVRVTNLENGRSIKLRINDRGPFAQGRIIDLSRRGAQLLGFYNAGTAPVRVEIEAEESRQLAIALTGTDYPGQAPGTMLASAPAPQPAYQAPASAPQAVEEALPVTPIPEVAPIPETAPIAEAAPTAEPIPAAMGIAPEPVIDDAGGPVPAVSSFEVGAAPLSPVEPLPAEPAAPPVIAPAPPVAVAPLAPAVVGKVRLSERSRAYVQAGAFSHPANVAKARVQLARLGPVHVTNIGSDGRDLWRVRLGPLASPDEAERLVAPVLRSGYPGSHVVVE
jgi:rare lipoprotein A